MRIIANTSRSTGRAGVARSCERSGVSSAAQGVGVGVRVLAACVWCGCACGVRVSTRMWRGWMPCPPLAARAPLCDNRRGSIHAAFDSRIHSALQFAIELGMSVADVRHRSSAPLAVVAAPQPALQFAIRASSRLPSPHRARGFAIRAALPIGRARPNFTSGQNLPHILFIIRMYVRMSW
jgi:hypothetical protein